MKKLLTILCLLPLFLFGQTGDLDTLLQKKLIGQGEYTKRVYNRLFTQIGTKIGIETDPVFLVHPSHGISGTNITNWNLAYSWGNHATAGYVSTELDPIFLASLAYSITGTDTSHWNQAYRWGNHALAGYLLAEADPLFLAHLAHAINSTDTSHWNQAYRWGNHAAAGYLTSFTELDPVFLVHPAHGITGTNITNWNLAYSWGNHASAGYATTTQLNAKADTGRSGSIHLAADFTTSSTTAVSTNLSFPIGANQSYVVIISGHCSKATTNSGLRMAIDAPSGSTITGTEYRALASYSTALTNGEISAINTLGMIQATGIGVKVPFRIEFTITTSSTPGNVTLQGATVTSNTMTIYAGARMSYSKSRPV